MGSCLWWPGASPSTPKSPKALLSGCGYLPHISNSFLSKALSRIQLKSGCSIFMRLNYMKWLIFDHFLPTKWFSLIQFRGFLLSRRERETSQSIWTENRRWCYFLEERPGARGKGWTEVPSPVPRCGHCSWCTHALTSPWREDAYWSGEDKRRGTSTSLMMSHEILQSQSSLLRLKNANDCVFIRVRKHCPYACVKEHFQPAVFPLLGQMLSFDFFFLSLMFFMAVAFLD